MLQAFANIFRIAELRNRVFFTLGMLVVYRVGFWIPLPGVSQSAIKDYFEQQSGSAAGILADYVALFSGGALGQSTIFGLGIMPYISAAIIFQLLGSAVPALQELKKQPGGHLKIMEYTRYATIGSASCRASGGSASCEAPGSSIPTGSRTRSSGSPPSSA
jgi:preprotein translocase subunit SecY